MKIVKVPGEVELRPRSMKDSKATFPMKSFQGFLVECVENCAKFGKGSKQARLQSKILDVLEAMNGKTELSLEDEHYEAIKDAAEMYDKNPLVTPCLVPFLDAIDKAEDVKVPGK